MEIEKSGENGESFLFARTLSVLVFNVSKVSSITFFSSFSSPPTYCSCTCACSFILLYMMMITDMYIFWILIFWQVNSAGVLEYTVNVDCLSFISHCCRLGVLK